MDEFNNTIEARNKQAEYDAIRVINYEEMQGVLNKWLLIVDPGVVKLLVANIFANKIPSDPVWLFLIAPSAGSKTELMNGFLKVPECYSLSDLTPNTFLSGYKSKDKIPSLLHQLGTGKTIMFKDFTSLLDGNKDDLKDIMGQFRQVYDGYATKRLGTGDEITWKGKLGFVAGCTPIVEQRLSIVGAMGERFLSYYIKQPKRAALRAKMKANIGLEGQMRDEIQDAIAGYLKGLQLPNELPQVPDEIELMIESLTDFVAISRAVVMRGFDSKKEIEYIAIPEMSGRVFKQFYTIALALLVMNDGEWREEDTYILRNLAISSIHSVRYNLIKQLAQYKTEVKTSTLSMELGYPTTTIRRYLEDLAAISMDDGTIRILNRSHQGKGKPDLWKLTPMMLEILSSMGENVVALKEDSDFDSVEEDVPVGKPLEESVDDKLKELDDITGSFTPGEIARLGL